MAPITALTNVFLAAVAGSRLMSPWPKHFSSPLCLSGHYRLVYSHEAFSSSLNGLHDKESAGSEHPGCLCSGGAGWSRSSTAGACPGRGKVGMARSTGSVVKTLMPPLTPF